MGTKNQCTHREHQGVQSFSEKGKQGRTCEVKGGQLHHGGEPRLEQQVPQELDRGLTDAPIVVHDQRASGVRSFSEKERKRRKREGNVKYNKRASGRHGGEPCIMGERRALNSRSPRSSTEDWRMRQLSLMMPASTAGSSSGRDVCA